MYPPIHGTNYFAESTNELKICRTFRDIPGVMETPLVCQSSNKAGSFLIQIVFLMLKY